MTWDFLIYARLVGALGTWSDYRVVVEAPDYDSAVLKLYETHEHISIKSYREGK
jgi:hypothetical protein